MLEFFARLFADDFMPHGHCYAWTPEILWLNVVSDALIGLAYFSIPFALWSFVQRRRDLAFRWVFLLFAAFIMACGTTHFIDVWTVWHGTYRLEGVVKLITAIISVITAALLWPLIPRALALPSPTQLEAANAELRQQYENRVRAEEELRRLNHELEMRVEARTRDLARINEDLQSFASAASHDLREPMRMVKNYLSLLEERYAAKLDDKAKRYIRHATDGMGRTEAMVEDLLAFSRASIEAGRIEALDMRTIVTRCMADLEVLARQAHAEVSIGELPSVRSDPTAVRQILHNLLANAMTYRGDRPARVEIVGQRVPGGLLLSIRDGGIGIRPEDHARIFEPLVRLNSRDDYPRGSGLGLSICRRLVDRLGARLTVVSELGKGATFELFVPDAN